MRHTRLLGSCSLFVAAGCWGGTYVASKYALAYVGPFTLVLARYALASLIFVPLMWLRGPDPRARGSLRLIALTSFIGLGLSSWAQFFGTALSTAHAGALITSSAPAFMVIFAAVVLGERVTPQKVIALVVASVGVVTVVGPGNVGAGRGAVFGDILLVVAGITWALYSVLIRKLTLRIANVTVTGYVTVVGALLGVPFGVPDLVRTGVPTVAVGFSILYIGLISTALAYYLWNKGLELMEAGNASIFFFAQPLTGTFFSWLLLGETLNVGFFIGGALILIGVAIASIRLPRRGGEVAAKEAGAHSGALEQERAWGEPVDG
jgi:drug/metabolite transporter (DMT)-like permease